MAADLREQLGDALVAAPLHEQVKSRIMDRIVAGDWPEGFVLPAEIDLAKAFGVSYGTVRHAMSELTQEGVLMRRRRTGTVVTGRAPHHTLNRFYQYFRLHSSDGDLINTEAKVIHVERRAATAEEAERLKIAVGAEVGYLIRLRLADGRPVMIDRIVLPASRAPDFPEDPEEIPALIYRWLLEQYGLSLAAVREKVTARLATDEDKALLDLPVDTPAALLVIDEVAFGARNEPLLIMHHVALTDAHCYVNEVR